MKFTGILHSKHLLIAFSALLITSITLLSISYANKPYTVVKVKDKYLSYNVLVEPVIYVKPSLLYDYRDSIVGREAVLNLVRNVSLNVNPAVYLYNDTELGRVSRIDQRVDCRASLTIGEWVKSLNTLSVIVVDNRTGSKVYVAVNVSRVKEVVETISSEANIKVPSYTLNIYILFSIRAYYGNNTRTYTFQPIASLNFLVDQNKLLVKISSVSGEFSSDRERVFENRLLGMSINDLRRYTLLSTVAVGALLLVYISLNPRMISFRDKSINYYSKRYNAPIITVKAIGEKQFPGEIVELNSLADIFLLSKFLGKPVMLDSDQCLYVVSDKYVFKYCIEREA